MVGGYFRNSWHDITSSPGWFGKICLLALVGFIKSYQFLEFHNSLRLSC